MSKLRPECETYRGSQVAPPRDTTIFMAYEAVRKADGLCYGQLHDPKSGYSCAVGTLWDANDKLVLNSAVIDEIAGVNDMFDGRETPRQRKLRVLRWLRLQIDIMRGKAKVA